MTVPEKERVIVALGFPFRDRRDLAKQTRDDRLKHMHDPAMERAQIESDYESMLDRIIEGHPR